MFKKALIVFLSLTLLWSCAVHDKFPFICFRWSCIAAEFKLPHFDTNGMKAARKARVSMRKKKRQRAKNKRLSKKGKPIKNYAESEQEEVVVRKDSLKYRFAALREDRYIVISFNKKEPVRTDSIFVRYNADGDDVLDHDKQLIKQYLDSNKIETISIIYVREHFGDKKVDEQQNRHTSITKEHVAMFFQKLGVPREMIKLTNRK